MRRVVWLLAMALLLAVPASAASILINGSFELGPPPFGNQDIDIATGSTAITGWTVTAGGIDLLGPPWDVSEGVRAVDLDGRAPGGIEQTFSTVIGQLYAVSFDLSGNPGNGVPGTGLPLLKQVRVTADGFSGDYTFDSSAQAIAALVWQTTSFSFLATGTSTTLAFRSLSTDPNASYGALIDNVSVTAVPEPSIWWLLASGGLTACGLRFRRARNYGE